MAEGPGTVSVEGPEGGLIKALGTAQAWPKRTDEAGVRTLRCHGVIAEYFP